MKRELLFSAFLAAILVFVGRAWSDEYDGWEEIRPCLLDGDGAEFVKPIPGFGSNEFSGATELEAVQAAADFVANPENLEYVDEDGEVWTDAPQAYLAGEGDCEEFAILLCSILRFHTQGGIPAERVWVSIELMTVPGVGVVAGHAEVGYKMERRGKASIEPQLGLIYRGAPSGPLNFNDQWVKGGGRWLGGKGKGKGKK